MSALKAWRGEHVRHATQQAIRAMRDGASLHFSFENGRQHWRLTNGINLPREIAEQTIQHPHVVACGDCLFHGHSTSQTYRWSDYT
jgi:hypothetical protein